ncbi:MAG: P-loop NTPase [Phycisphaerales bacterium]
MTTIPSIPAASDQATRLRHLFNAVEQSQPAPRKRAKVVTISSGKGGVGKTNLAVNLAIALQSRGVRATVIDLDLGLANADLLCGLNPAARLDRAVASDAPLEELAVLAPGGFRLIPGSVGLTRGAGSEGSGGAAILSRLNELDACTDVLLLDTGAGMGQIVRASLRAADLALLVATPEPTSIADAYALLKVTTAGTSTGMSGASGAQFVPMLLLNQCASTAEAQEVHQRLLGVSQRFLGREFPLLAAIPADEALPRAVRARRPLLLSEPSSPAALAIALAAEGVAGKLGFQVENRGGLSVDGLGRLTRLFTRRSER